MKTLCIVLAALCLVACRRNEDRVVSVDKDDAEMNGAITTACTKLPYFWQHFEARAEDESGFVLKVKVEDKHGVEYFWCGDIRRGSDGMSAVVDNDPGIVKSVKLGQRIVVKDSEIADWMFIRAGMIVGNYTLRPLLKTLAPEEKRELEGRLAALP